MTVHFYPPTSRQAARAYHRARKCYERCDYQGALYFQAQGAYLARAVRDLRLHVRSVRWQVRDA